VCAALRLPALSSILSQMSADAADSPMVEWTDGLRAPGAVHEETVARLRVLLLRAARFEVQRRRASLPVKGPELEDIAHQAADDAVVAIIAKLDDFRGESRFVTWAYKFVIFEVSTKVARHFWRAGSATVEEVDWERIDHRLAVRPEHRAEQRELLAALRRAVDEDLTQHQRKVFVAIALNDVPVDVLAVELGTNRNAIYKTLFDARRKLRGGLAAAGYALPSTPEWS
jgi:RNA polymerase sigma-70 factor, ECF subfamily